MKKRKLSQKEVRREFERLSAELNSAEAQRQWGQTARKALLEGAKKHEQLQARSREISLNRRERIKGATHAQIR